MKDEGSCRYAGHFPELERSEYAQPRVSDPVGVASPLLTTGLSPKRKMERDYRDITGKQYGMMRVDERVSGSTWGSMWRATCLVCGKQGTYCTYDLTHHHRMTCGDWNCRRAWQAERARREAAQVAKGLDDGGEGRACLGAVRNTGETPGDALVGGALPAADPWPSE
jgi:hypothetical protein